MSEKGSRSKNSALNATSSLILTFTNGFLGIIVTRLVIAKFGSDFNGLNSTANQIINVLLMLEGGFALASNVALFSPLNKRDYMSVNGILTATRNRFRKIGAAFLAIGILVSGGYALLVKSSLSKDLIALVIFMTVLPQSVNLFFATTYRVLVQAQQKEYIITFIATFTIFIGHILNIAIIAIGGQMWLFRFITMISAILNSILIVVYVKKKNPFIDFHTPMRQDMIKGTKDVFVQKLTGVIYNSAPIVFLSITPAGGTLLASVYAVYNNVFLMIKNLLRAFIDAPRLGIGEMLTERSNEELWVVFQQYQFLAFLAVHSFLTTATALILPFISLYTQGIDDVAYYDKLIAILMVLIAAVEIIHIPSGHLINMSGKFRVSRDFQLLACVLLIVTMSITGTAWGIYGLLASLLLTAVVLAILEIGYVHVKFFHNKQKYVLKSLLPLIAVGTVVSTIEMRLSLNLSTFSKLLLSSVPLFLFNTVIGIGVGYLFNRETMLQLLSRLRILMGRN